MFVRHFCPLNPQPSTLNFLLRLRVKDVDLERGQLIVRAGKGDQDRVTMVPAMIRLTSNIERATLNVQRAA